MYERGGGAYKIPAAASKYTPPPPSPEKCLMARNEGGGGVVCNFALDLRERMNKYIYIYISLSNLESLNFLEALDSRDWFFF